MKKSRIILILIAAVSFASNAWSQFSISGDTRNEITDDRGPNATIKFGMFGNDHETYGFRFHSKYTKDSHQSYESDIFQITNTGRIEFQNVNPDSTCSISLMKNNVTNVLISNRFDRLNLVSRNHVRVVVNGKVEVASFQPDKILFNKDVEVDQEGIEVKMGVSATDLTGWIGTKTGQGCILGTNNAACMFMDINKVVYVGGITPTEARGYSKSLRDKYKLFVKKGVLAEDYAIAPTSTWSDFVFNENYRLKNIREVENFIDKNKHLPDVPSARQVAEEGYSQHDMNKVLLQKIEELTLYIIQQQKEIDGLKKDLNETGN